MVDAGKRGSGTPSPEKGCGPDSAPPSSRHVDLSGRRVLVVEDSFLIADVVSAVLRNCGCDVIGPVGRLAEALHLALTPSLDAAALDVNLGGDLVFPVAEVLRARGIPFFFVTGYAEDFFPSKQRSVPRLDKPFGESALEEMLVRVLGHPLSARG